MHPPPTVIQRLKELVRKRTLKPFAVLLIVFFISQFSGTHAMRPYIVLILSKYGTPISPNWATVALGVTGIVGTITCVLTVKLVGKRRLFLISLIEVILAGTALSKCYNLRTNSVCWRLKSISFAGVYGFYHLPKGVTSFNSARSTEESYFPLAMFILMGYGTAVGVVSVPWMLLSEVFPFKYVFTLHTKNIRWVFNFLSKEHFFRKEFHPSFSNFRTISFIVETLR